MIKKTVNYLDFDGKDQTEDVYFNISKIELMDHLDLADEFGAMHAVLDGDKKELALHEIKQMLDLIKKLMRIAYGVRSEDGKRFAKSDQIWEEFTQTAVYDAALMSLFENPNEGITFIQGILPSDLVAQAQIQLADEAEGKKVLETALAKAPKDDMSNMSREDLEAMFKAMRERQTGTE